MPPPPSALPSGVPGAVVAAGVVPAAAARLAAQDGAAGDAVPVAGVVLGLPVVAAGVVPAAAARFAAQEAAGDVPAAAAGLAGQRRKEKGGQRGKEQSSHSKRMLGWAHGVAYAAQFLHS